MRSIFTARNSRIALAITLAITLGACAKHDMHPSPAPRSTSNATPKSVHVAKARHEPAIMPAAAPQAPMTKAPMAATDKNMLDAPTGIAECDDYLGNYRACHAVLGTQFTNIDAQLTELRTNILDAARDKGMQAARAKCIALVQQRDEALKGRSCK